MNSEGINATQVESDLANNLIKFREDSLLNKATVAKEIGTTRSNITRWEKGTTPSISWLIRLAELYSVSVDKLIRGNNEKNEGDPCRPSLKSKKKKKAAVIYTVNTKNECSIKKEENPSNIINIKKTLCRGEIAIIIKPVWNI